MRSIFLESLNYMLYLGTVEVVPVSNYHHFPRGMMFMEDIWPSYSHIKTVIIFGQLVYLVS